MKKIFIFFVFLVSLFGVIYAQNNSNDDIKNESSNFNEKPFKKAENFIDFLSTVDFIMQFEPGVFINNYKTDSTGKIVSAPSPIIYPISIGFLWPDYTFLATQPTISFYMNNHLYYEGKALPAEIENRTTTTLSFMVNIPLVISLFINKSKFQLSGGIGTLLQFGILSAGVNDYDYGYSGSAVNDVSLINNYFWNNMHWLYITTGASWLYTFNNKIKLGPTCNMYIPVGTLISNQNLHGFIFSVGVKVCL